MRYPFSLLLVTITHHNLIDELRSQWVRLYNTDYSNYSSEWEKTHAPVEDSLFTPGRDWTHKKYLLGWAVDRAKRHGCRMLEQSVDVVDYVID